MGILQSVDFSKITPIENMDMGLLRSPEGLNITGSYDIRQPDYMSMLSGLGSSQGGQQPQQMPFAPAPHIQAGGEAFNPFYAFSPFQPRPTAQALSGLLGGAYGTV